MVLDTAKTSHCVMRTCRDGTNLWTWCNLQNITRYQLDTLNTSNHREIFKYAFVIFGSLVKHWRCAKWHGWPQHPGKVSSHSADHMLHNTSHRYTNGHGDRHRGLCCWGYSHHSGTDLLPTHGPSPPRCNSLLWLNVLLAGDWGWSHWEPFYLPWTSFGFWMTKAHIFVSAGYQAIVA